MSGAGSIDSDKVLRYVADLRSYYAAYHNHKETSAWAAIAFSVLLAGPVVATLIAVIDGSISMRVTVTFGILAVFFVAFAYMKEQFHRRRDAANVVEACDYFAAYALIAEELKATDFTLRCVEDEPNEALRNLPECIRSKVESLGRKVQPAIVTLENSAYFLLIFLFVLMLLRIWI